MSWRCTFKSLCLQSIVNAQIFRYVSQGVDEYDRQDAKFNPAIEIENLLANSLNLPSLNSLDKYFGNIGIGKRSTYEQKVFDPKKL